MESLVREALTLSELDGADIDRLRQYYADTERAPLKPEAARVLLNYLVSKAGLKDENKTQPMLLPKAKAAINSIAYFLSEDRAFQDEFEKLTVSQIRSKLKLSRHILEGPPDHRDTCFRLIYMMATRFKKFEAWRNYINKEAHTLVEEGLEPIFRNPPPENDTYRPADSRLPSPGQYYEQTADEIVRIFETDVQQGLTDDQAAARRPRYGLNELPKPPPTSIWSILWFQATDFMVIMLMVATILELVLREYVPAVVLFLVVFFNILVGFVQELKAQRALAALETLQVPHAQVVRGGVTMNILASELVPGDIVILDEGCQVPADMRLVEAVNLQIVEALLTGESVPAEKICTPIRATNLPLGDIRNMAFMSTSVMRGRGVGVVTATGRVTEVGKISKELTKKEDNQTVLQKRLRGLGKALIVIAVVLCVVIVAIILIRLHLNGHLEGSSVLTTIETGVSLAVSVIPEGLVAVTTITMALGVQRMAQKNALVKRLHIVESLGSITVICSDKTGTLTEGNMKAEELSLGPVYRFSGSGFTPDGDILDAHEHALRDFNEKLRIALMCCALCNNSSVTFNEEKHDYVPVGDPTEVAILMAAEKAKLEKAYWMDNGWAFENEVPFDSDRKCMSVLYRFRPSDKSRDPHPRTTAKSPASIRHSGPSSGTDSGAVEMDKRKTKKNLDNTYKDLHLRDDAVDAEPLSELSAVMLAKGAPEAILKKCSRYYTDSNDKIVTLDEPVLAHIEKVSVQMASNGLRVLALAYKPFDMEEYNAVPDGDENKLEPFENELVFLGLIGLIDPPRMEVKDAIACCKSAGILVCMITGDHPLTARAIAEQLSICEPGDDGAIIKGVELDAYGDNIDLIAERNPFPTVFARVSPQHKLKIVEALKHRGDIAAMTGDGVNDAPAIKQANVGVAMGKTGTDLTKEAADIILLDDNFGTIVEAIKEGRHIYDNIKKFILYLLSCNSAEVYMMLLCAIIGLPTPFTPIMILWVNLVADIPPALTLGVDPPESDVMERLPRDPNQNIFNKKTVGLLLFQGFSIAVWTLMFYMVCLYYEEPQSLVLAYGGELASSASEGEIAEAERGLLRARTLALNVLTFEQLIHAFLSKSVRNTMFSKDFFNNTWLLGGVALSAILMIAGIYVPGLNDLLDQGALQAIDWVKIIAGCAIHVFCVEMYKVVLRCRSKYRPLNTKFYDDV